MSWQCRTGCVRSCERCRKKVLPGTYIHLCDMTIHGDLFFSQNLNNLAGLVRGVLPSLTRKIIGALITLDVHSRDVVTLMVKNKVCFLVLLCSMF
jgi:hypothetical protein